LGSSPQPKKEENAPLIYKVTVDPPSAKLEVKNGETPATLSGGGKEREIRIEKWQQLNGLLHVVASCEGYESAEEWLSPLPGLAHDVSIVLKKTQAKPTEDAPAVYYVTVEPSWADLRADSDRATITGSGSPRHCC
jgi:glycine cleavage system regulatory protein